MSAERRAATSPSVAPDGHDSLAILRQLTTLSRTVAQAGSLDLILQLAARHAAGMLGADQSLVMLVGDDGLVHTRAAHGLDPSQAAALEGVLNERLIERLEEILTADASRVFMAVPLIVRGEVTGLLAVTRPSRRPWTDDDEVLLAAVADQSAAPIEIARLSEEVRQARLVAENLRLSESERAVRAELEEERVRLVSVLDNIPSGVVLVEAPSGHVTFVNRAVTELLHLPRTAPQHAAVDMLNAGTRGDGLPASPEELPLVRALRLGETVSGEEIECLRTDGTSVILSVSATAIRDASERVVAAVATFSDVTHRRRMERHLRQVQKMDAVGRLAGGVAHETNNQMMVVLSATAFVLRRADLAEEVRQDLHQIHRAAERTARVTAQLLAFSRRQVMRPELLEFDGVVADLAPVLRRTLGEDSTMHLRLESPHLHVRADRGQLEQVLLNLAMNARDAMPAGGSFTLETRPVTLEGSVEGAPPGLAVRPGEYLLLTATDDGEGMLPDTLNHLFEPFFTTKPVGKGTGLGLATVYGIVKQTDGYVWAASEPGRGATFMIYLPVERDGHSTPTAAQPSSKAARGESVLIVEDEAAVLTMMARALRDEGYQVIEATNGEIALDILGQGSTHPDLLLTDVAMPGMNGSDLALRLRARHPRLPVVFMSGHMGAETLHPDLLGPDTVYLLKPFTPETVAQCVRTLLDRARTARSGRPPNEG